MGRAKYKPRVRRLKRAAIDTEKACIARWTTVLEKHPVGSLIHRKAAENIKLSQHRLNELQEWDTP